jgi:mannose/fructose/N-acetylgalactosamine-specific phosphotransferase system component IIC
MMHEVPRFAALITWGVLVGIDLVTAPQGLFSRPLVAAAVAGLILGHGLEGLIAGMVLELYALEVLPIGATRYPDFGLGAVAGGTAAALGPAEMAPALAGLVGLPIAILGGWTMHQLRRRNARSVQRRLERVASGEARAIWELQRNGFLRDAARSLGVTILGLGFALLAIQVPWRDLEHVELLSWAAIAGGLAAALAGSMRNAGAGARRRWFAVGLAVGVIVVLSQ